MTLSHHDNRELEAARERRAELAERRARFEPPTDEQVRMETDSRKNPMNYHSDYAAVSRSMLMTLKRSPRLYHELYIARTRQPEPPTEAMVRGIRFDNLLLDPRSYRAKYAISPANGPNGEPWDRRRKEHKAAWEAWCSENVGKEPITAAEHNELLVMVGGALRHSEIDRICTAEGSIQHRLDWHDPIKGIPCKGLADKLFAGDDLIVDIKTAADPSPEAFQRAVANFGYHIQAAFYSLGYRINFGEQPRFLFCVVGSKPPYDSAVYELDDAAIGAGESEAEFLLNKLTELHNTNDWQPSWGRGVITLELPRWHDPYKSEIFE